MNNSRIGLVGRSDDPGLDLLKQRIEDRGARATTIDFWHFPNFAQTYIKGDTVVYDGIDLTSLHAFYLKQLGYFSPLPQKHFTKEEWAEYYERFNDYMTNEREVMSFRESVIQILSELRPVINPYGCAFYHKLKPYQYRRLASQGLPVPEFIAGNEFFEMRDFLGRGTSVAKPLTSGFVNRITISDLERDKESLRKRPVIIQEEISGKMLRSFVLGDGVIGTCEIVHLAEDADARRNVVAMERFDLPERFKSLPVDACRALGMIFAGVDLLYNQAADRIYILECNPSPLFRNFEAQTGLPLTESLARYLIEEASL